MLLGGGAYTAIEKNLKDIGLQEFDDYIGSYIVGKKLAILYGNCHIQVLKDYLNNNPWFSKIYIIREYLVFKTEEQQYPVDTELAHCKLLIGEDIQEINSYMLPSMDSLAAKTSKDCICIKIPNLYGYNFFWPQIGEQSKFAYKHLNENAIDINLYPAVSGNVIKTIVHRLGYIDTNIERMCLMGESAEQICFSIRNMEMYAAEDIRRNFTEQMQKIKKREKLCDIQISDYLEKNYKNYLLFYDPFHPTEFVIREKGRRILEFLKIPIDETLPITWRLDYQEIFIYGCVKKALGMNFEQTHIRRRDTRSTLSNRAVDLEEYVYDYIAWVCEEE